MLLRRRNVLGVCVLLARVAISAPQDNGPIITATPSATKLIVTATTGDHPVVTFMPSQDAQYTNITQTVTTTNQFNQTIIILPLGIIWAPVPPVPPIPPEPPIETIPDVPDGENNEACTSYSMTGCSVTVSYISTSSSWTT